MKKCSVSNPSLEECGKKNSRARIAHLLDMTQRDKKLAENYYT